MNPSELDSIQSPSKKNLLYFCFNPLCKQSTNRIFNNTRQHMNQCQKWIISNDLTNMFDSKHDKFNEKKGIYLQFQEKPMQVVMSSVNLKDLCQMQLKGYLQKVKLDMEVSLWTVQNVLMMKIDKYFDPLTSFCHQAKTYISEYGQSGSQTESLQKQNIKINTILQNLNLNDITNLQSQIFLPDCTQIQQKIRSSIQQLTQQIFCTKLSLISDISLSNTQKNNLIKYLKDPEDEHNKRSFKITNLFKIQQRNIYQKKIRYINNQTITQLVLKCPVCSTNFTTGKKKQLMLLWNNLTQHIINNHIEQAGYSFQHLISGKAACLISIDQIIYRMINYGYQCLQLIYKSNKRGYTFHYSNKNKLSVEIRCKGQTYQLPLHYIQINQFHEFCSLITTIAYTIQKNMYKPKPIYIYINNHLQICYIRKICDLMMLKNIFIVNQRRHDQSTIIYQEDCQDHNNSDRQILYQQLDISKDSKDSKEFKDVLNYGEGQEEFKSSY